MLSPPTLPLQSLGTEGTLSAAIDWNGAVSRAKARLFCTQQVRKLISNMLMSDCGLPRFYTSPRILHFHQIQIWYLVAFLLYLRVLPAIIAYTCQSVIPLSSFRQDALLLLCFALCFYSLSRSAWIQAPTGSLPFRCSSSCFHVTSFRAAISHYLSSSFVATDAAALVVF